MSLNDALLLAAQVRMNTAPEARTLLMEALVALFEGYCEAVNKEDPDAQT